VTIELAIRLVHDLGENNNMTRGQEYGHTSRFKVQHLGIVEDLVDEHWMMAASMRRGWTLSLVFGVEWSDKQVDRKD
jgi:hypothetical protein